MRGNMKYIIKKTLENHECKSNYNKYKILEFFQESILYSLSKTDFFDNYSLYGSSALRLFYNLDRFSEDLDFSLKKAKKNTELISYLEHMKKDMISWGLNVTIEDVTKTFFCNKSSTYVKSSTKAYILTFNSDSITKIFKNDLLTIKIEIFTESPQNVKYELKTRDIPITHIIDVYGKSSLFAGKVDALLTRQKIKSKDFYDFIYYLNTNSKINLPYLEELLKISHGLNKNEKLTLNSLKILLLQKFEITNFEEIKSDLLSLSINNENIKYWNKEFFINVTSKIKSDD